MWNGVFVTKAAGNPVGTVENPRYVSEPPYPIPDYEDLEVWGGAGTAVDSFIYGNVHYVAVRFDHTNVCFSGEDAPSNSTTYVYVYDENDLEDLLFDELGITPQ